nr:hypothetical protein CFP56_76376 [Quercus suber]
MQVELPPHRYPHEAAVPREETAFLRLSLEEEINQFQLKEEREEQGEPVIQVSDSEDKPDRSLSVRPSRFVVVLRKKDKDVVEDGELVPYNKGVSPKLPKTAKGKGRASSVESKEAKHVAEGVPERERPLCSDTMKQPLLFLKDMAALKNVKQQDLFLSLKRDLALAIEEVFMVEEWVKDVRNEARLADNLRAKTSKSLANAKKDKDKGKEAKTLPESKGPEDVQGKDAAPKTKGSEPVKPQAVAQEKKTTSGKTTDSTISQPASKEDPPPPTQT